jgi:hypothetical protein
MGDILYMIARFAANGKYAEGILHFLGGKP